MAKDHHVQLGAAIASAMRDGCALWANENHHMGNVGESLAQFAQRIEVNAQITPGGPMVLVVEVVDRRPGRSSLTSYVLERSPKGKALFRRQS